MVRVINGVRRYSLDEYKEMQRAYAEGPGPIDYRLISLLDPKPKPTSKYGSRKAVVDGIVFDSNAEADRYIDLKNLRHAGEISWFNLQPSFRLSGGVRYRPDFIVCDKAGKLWVEDVKGFETKDFMVKKRIFISEYPSLELRIIKAPRKR